MLAIEIGQPMRIVSLRHTPAIFGRDIGNDTIYEGLEFEVKYSMGAIGLS